MSSNRLNSSVFALLVGLVGLSTAQNERLIALQDDKLMTKERNNIHVFVT
jgi:hypothetical protein